ncbi:MAG: type II toxin-antitoxin system VapC family toxin [Candidatus Thermoplasmatota archaeon]|nr:type II toxin-antitoxin system VapC family toxin [Candidatus Thermoplasmatota archaeon]
MILVDTDVLIEIFDKESKKGEKALQKLKQTNENIAICSLNLHEILFGHYKRKKNVEEIITLTTLDFTKEDAKLSAKIETDLEGKRKTNTRIDTMIAAIAINNHAKIFTFNKKHFLPIKEVTLFE